MEQFSDVIYETQFPFSQNAKEKEAELTVDFQDFPEDRDRALTEVRSVFEKHGAVILTNTDIQNEEEMLELGLKFGQPMDYVGGTNDRTSKGGVYDVGAEPAFANVPAHNEMSYMSLYPATFLIGAYSAPAEGGETSIADNQAITKEVLKTDFGQKFLKEGALYTRNFFDKNCSVRTSGMTAWQDVFATNSRAVAEEKIKQVFSEKYTIHWNEQDGAMRVTYLLPAMVYDDDLKEDIWFTSVCLHGYWFRGWKPFSEMPNIDRPSHLQFGDGSELEEEHLSEMIRIVNSHSVSLKWHPGKIAILRNRRYLHARLPYKLKEGETRKMSVLLLNPTKRPTELQ